MEASSPLRDLAARTHQAATSSRTLEGEFGALAQMSDGCASGCGSAWSYASAASMDDGETDSSSNGQRLHQALQAVMSRQEPLSSQSDKAAADLGANLQSLEQLSQQARQLAAAATPGPAGQALAAAAEALERALQEQQEAGKTREQLGNALPFAAADVEEADSLSTTVAADGPGQDVSWSARAARDCTGEAQQYYYSTRGLAWDGRGQQGLVTADTQKAAEQLDRAVQLGA